MQVSKEDFEKALRLVSRATVDQLFLPVLSHVCFIQGEGIRTYNDVQAVTVPMDVDFKSCAVHAATLLRVVASAPTEAVISLDLQKTELHIRFKKAHVKLPVLPEKDFLFNPLDSWLESSSLKLPSSFISAMVSVLFSVGDDPSRPVSTVVTVDRASSAVWSTDVRSVSRMPYKFKALNSEGDEPLFVPPTFINIMQELLGLIGDSPLTLYLLDDNALYAVSESGYAVFTKLGYDASPPDLAGVFGRLSSLIVATCEAPPGLNDALLRCIVVLDRATEDKCVTLSIDSKGLRLEAQSSFGTSRDQLRCECDGDASLQLDPLLLQRALRHSITRLQMCPDALILSTESGLTHVLARVGYTKPAQD